MILSRIVKLIPGVFALLLSACQPDLPETHSFIGRGLASCIEGMQQEFDPNHFTVRGRSRAWLGNQIAMWELGTFQSPTVRAHYYYDRYANLVRCYQQYSGDDTLHMNLDPIAFEVKLAMIAWQHELGPRPDLKTDWKSYRP